MSRYIRVEVGIKKLHSDAVIPQYATIDSSGADLYSIEDVEIPRHEWRLVHTGIAIELPSGFEIQIRPRSGLALKHGVTVLNTPGTIDADYRGELGVILINHSNKIFRVKKGMKIAQAVLMPIDCKMKFTIKSVLSDTERGEGGFGSTGL